VSGGGAALAATDAEKEDAVGVDEVEEMEVTAAEEAIVCVEDTEAEDVMLDGAACVAVGLADFSSSPAGRMVPASAAGATEAGDTAVAASEAERAEADGAGDAGGWERGDAETGEDRLPLSSRGRSSRLRFTTAVSHASSRPWHFFL
jgi:hypothetical protein